MQRELPAYLAAAESVSLYHQTIQQCQPSSAAVERDFSVLKSSFGDELSKTIINVTAE